MKFLEGLYSYEVMLLVLGALLFVVTLFAFVVFVMRGRPFARLLWFFLLAIIMIGYPSIRSIEFSNGVIKIEKDTHDLQQDPTNKTVRDALAGEVAHLSPRPSRYVPASFASCT
jgi:hypothetical protein